MKPASKIVSAAMVLAWFAAGCSRYSAPAPQPTQISPDHKVRLRPSLDGPLQATIRGDDLAGGIGFDLKTGEIVFEGEFQARLGSTALTNVRPFVEDGALVLMAQLPADMELGIYDLSVVVPDGQTGVLPAAFEVRSITAVDLSTRSENDPPVAGDPVTITASVRDGKGDLVPAAANDDVLFSLDGGSGSFRPSQVVSGSVQVIYDTATTAEGALIRATEQLGGDDVSGSVLVDSRAGNVAGLRISPGSSSAPAGSDVPLTAWLVDARDNIIPAVLPADIEFELIEGNGSLGTTTVEQGRVAVSYTTHTIVERARIKAIERVSTHSLTAEATIDGMAGPPVRLGVSVTPPDPVAGDPATLAAELQDEFGNMIALADAGDVVLKRISGRGILSGTVLFGGQCLAIYSTYRKVEVAVIQAELSVLSGIPHAQVEIATRGGAPAGVTILPNEARAGAGERIDLFGWLTDLNGNLTPAASAGDIDFSIISGPGGLVGQPELVGGAIVIGYEAPDAVGQTAAIRAVENVTGDGNSALTNILIDAGPADSFEVAIGFGSLPAGTPFNIGLTARDRFGNRATSFNGFVFLSDTTQTLTPGVSGAFTEGTRNEYGNIPVARAGVVIRAQDSAGHFGDSAPFDVTGGGVDHFAIDPPAGQVAGQPFVIGLRAIDELGNPVESFAGSVFIADSTRTIAPQGSGNFSAGVRNESVTITRAAAAVVIDVRDGLGHYGSSIPFDVAAGSPAAIVFVSPPRSALAGSVSEIIELQIADGFGNPSPLPAAAELLLLSSAASGLFDLDGAGAFDGSIDRLGIPAGGYAAGFYYKDTLAGDPLLTVRDAAGALTQASQAIKIDLAGNPARLSLIGFPPQLTAGVPSGAFVVQLQDAGGATVTIHPPLNVDLSTSNPAGSFDADPAGSFDGTFTQVTIASGTSDAIFYYRDTLSGPAVIGVTAPALVGDSRGIQIVGGPVVGFEFDQIPAQQAGRPFFVRLAARDAWDNLADGFAGTVNLSDSSGTLDPAISGPFVAGQHSESMSVTGAIGADLLTADDGSGHAGQSNPFAVLPGPVDHFEIGPVTSPQAAGIPFNLSLTARDAYANIASSFVGSVDITDSSATLLPAQSGVFAAGLRDENIAITQARQDIVVSINDGQGHAGQSNPFQIAAGPLDHFDVGPVPERVGISAPFAVPLWARDSYGNLVTVFAGTVFLSDATGTLAPSISGDFAGGARSESLAVSMIAVDDFIHADDGAGHEGLSNLFDVSDAQPVELVASFEFVPPACVEGERFELRLHVLNNGDLTALGVQPITVAFAGSGSGSLVAEPAQPWPDVPGRTEHVFSWSFTTGSGDRGWFEAEARAQGTDEDSGLGVTSNLATASLPISPGSCLINPLVADAGPDREISCGGSVAIGGDPAAMGGVPAYAFIWTPNNGLSGNAVANPIAGPDIDTTYRLLASDQLGCAAEDSLRVTLADGPQAVIENPTHIACLGQNINFNAGGSSGVNPLTYEWDFGTGDTDNNFVSSYSFSDRGWYVVSLTVTDANGCRAQALLPLGISSGSEAAGPIAMTAVPAGAPADGVSLIAVDSDRITKCYLQTLDPGKRFHVLATRGEIVSPDEDGADGIQVRSDFAGKIHISLRADRIGGAGRLLAMTARPEQESRGTAGFTFSGSSSLPRVTGFTPAGFSDLPPPRFAVRFDKPMSAATLQEGISLSSPSTGELQGIITYDATQRTAFFTPEVLLDPLTEEYTLTVSQTVSDIWGNPLDGNYNGSAGAFSWKFGAVADDNQPYVNCQGTTNDPFSPDGDGNNDLTGMRADLYDDQGLMLWSVRIFDADGLAVRNLEDVVSHNQNDARLEWDGRDQDGLLVNNGVYNYTVVAFDAAGNVSSACGGSVEVLSLLDPAEFP
ncbi:MAG TPA: Ig-like domain-containing protein [Myxococcota bacterium]|nr:Ig-like domain-containing protein [Myxococcota bacterium]